MADEPVDNSPEALIEMVNQAQKLVDQLCAEHDRRVTELLEANTRLVYARREAEDRAAKLAEENLEYQTLFEKQHERTRKADLLWRKSHPGKELVIPDLGDLIDWLIKRGDYVNEVLNANDTLSDALRKERQRNFGGSKFRDLMTAVAVNMQEAGMPQDIMQLLFLGKAGSIPPNILKTALMKALNVKE